MAFIDTDIFLWDERCERWHHSVDISGQGFADQNYQVAVTPHEVAADESEARAYRSERFQEVYYHPRLMPANAFFSFLRLPESRLPKNKFEQIADIGSNDMIEQVSFLTDE